MKYLLILLFTLLSFNLYSQDSYIPTCDKAVVIKYRSFYVGYSENFEQPIWTMYRYYARPSTYDRSIASFKKDTRYQCIAPSKYDHTGFDKGHMCPAEDFSFDSLSLKETFYMTNMTPQYPQFNRGIWKSLEHQVREWGKTDTIIVIQGTYFTKYENVNGLLAPTHFYKIIYSEKRNCAIAFLFKNQKLDGGFMHYAVSVDYIESITNIDFFSNIKDQSFEQNIGTCFKPN